MPRYILLFTTIATILVAVLLSTFKLELASIRRLTTQLPSVTRKMATNTAKRTPVYFVSHGGPTTMYNTDHPVYPHLQALGREITQKVRPSAIVVFSAHWQAQRANTVEINFSEQEPLLYDFYGFPRHYYAEKYPNQGSASVAKRVAELVGQAGFQVTEEERGLDHGVFVPFKIMFSPEANPANVPIVQVSLLENERDAEGHLRLGRAVQKLREENVCVIVSGMAVHNLRDFMRAGSGKPMPYSVSFDDALKAAVEREPGTERDEEMKKLLKRPDSRQAHPTFEHLLPIHIGVGAAGEDRGKQLWTMPEGSMSWAQFRFGDIQS